jgi:hypothetical protein
MLASPNLNLVANVTTNLINAVTSGDDIIVEIIINLGACHIILDGRRYAYLLIRVIIRLSFFTRLGC